MIFDKVKVIVLIAIFTIGAGISQYLKYRALRKEYEARLQKLPPKAAK